MGTIEAVNELLDMDVEFFLFVHARTNEDVVVYRRDDGRIGLLHPPFSKLADENDIVVPEPSRYSRPLTLDEARTEMNYLNHRFLYFIDAADMRGKVLYLRHDGDYGLVEPE
jgi:putative sigma-54 modulation protein